MTRWLTIAGLLSACGTIPEDKLAEAHVFEVDGPAGTSDDDQDGDGVVIADDCDDDDPAVGALLYANSLDDDDGHLASSPGLDDAWFYEAGVVGPDAGDQQALLGDEQLWGDTVTFVTVGADGARSDGQDTERFRAGLLARAIEDAALNTGFSGYRCAVAANAEGDTHAAGPFVQISAFTDQNGFDQVAREDRGNTTPVLTGAQATLSFWLVGDSLTCVFSGTDGERVVASATDDRMAAGGTGLSTLNALATFDDLLVCQALRRPE